MDVLAIAREYLPEATEEHISHVLWNYTGFPAFWAGDPETCLREQLQHYVDCMKAGADPLEGMGY